MWNYSDSEFIKTFRKIINWEWYTDVCTFKLFMHCLLKANWKSGSWHGYKYQRGQFITSLPHLADETGLTVQEVRTALKHLKSTGELTDKCTNKIRVITVINFDKYQGEQQTNQQATNRQLTGNQQATNSRYKNIKNNKEDKKKDKPLRGKYFDDPTDPLNDPKLLDEYLECTQFAHEDVERAVMIRRKELGLDE